MKVTRNITFHERTMPSLLNKINALQAKHDYDVVSVRYEAYHGTFKAYVTYTREEFADVKQW